MKLADMIELARLGFKPSDIKELLSMPDPSESNDPKEDPKKDPKKDPKEDPKEDPFGKLAKS